MADLSPILLRLVEVGRRAKPRDNNASPSDLIRSAELNNCGRHQRAAESEKPSTLGTP